MQITTQALENKATIKQIAYILSYLHKGSNQRYLGADYNTLQTQVADIDKWEASKIIDLFTYVSREDALKKCKENGVSLILE